jgi:DNA-binding XRE family transcriptional regulator
MFGSCRPTEALPGTAAKIVVFQARAASHQPLFNAADREAADGYAKQLITLRANGHIVQQKLFHEGFLERSRRQSMQLEPFCVRLKRCRREAGLSQRALAQRAHLDSITITRLEQGQRDPRLATVKALALALEISLERLIGS